MDRRRLSTIRGRLADGLDGLSRAIERRFSIDYRALAAFRIALGALILADLLRRTRTLEAFHTDMGVLPREALFSDYTGVYSLHALSGEAWVQALLFVVAGAVAVSLLVGYRTRAATIVSWLLLLSLHTRNPMVLNAGDTLLRLLLLWSIFLPLGARWSVDARRFDREEFDTTLASVATMAILLQVLLMYVTNAVHKTRSDLWMEGEALTHILQADHLTILLGNAITEYHQLLELLTYAWMVLILCSPLLLLLAGIPRAAFASLFVGMHLGMLVTLRIDLFPLIVPAGLLLFYPPVVWDALERAASRLGVASPLARGLETLQGTLPSLSLPDVSLERPSLRELGASAKIVAATVIPWLLLVLVVLSNAEAVGYAEVPDPGDDVLDVTQADQSWRMFAPNPGSTSHWFAVPGELEDGTEVDVHHGGAVDWDRPPNVDETYDTSRERKYLTTMRFADNENHRSYFANSLCERWNAEHETELESLQLYGMSDRSGPHDDEPDVISVNLLDYDCDGEFVQND